MTRILVYPEELRAVSQQLRAAAAELRNVRDRFTREASAHAWSLRSRVTIDQETAAARAQAEALIRMAEEMARYTGKKAQDFEEADGAGARGLTGLWSDMVGALHRAKDAFFTGGLGWRKDLDRWIGIGRLVPGVGSLLPVISLPWLRQPGSGLFPPLRPVGVSGGAALPASPTPAAPSPGPAQDPTARAATDPTPAAAAQPGRVAMERLQQGGQPWSDIDLGKDKWEKAGCLLTSFAMVMKHYDTGIDVQRPFMFDLRQGTANGSGDVVWDRADSYLTDNYGLAMEHERMPEGPRTEAIAIAMKRSLENLSRTPPVPTIFGVGGPPHWVVVSGFTGDPANPKPEDFTINDPGLGRPTLNALLTDPKYKDSFIDAVVTITKKTG